MFEKLKKFCDSFLDLGVPGFDLVVYKDGECILRYMNGYSDLENKIKINGNERYNIYSCSKVITCTAALQLMEKGLFSLEDSNSKWEDYHEASSDYIKDMFGERLSGAIITENSNDCASGITAKTIKVNQSTICKIINTIPSYNELINKYEILGVKSNLSDIDVPDEKLDLLLEYSPLVRNRLTLMRLRRELKKT